MDQAAIFKLTYGLFILTAKQGWKDNGCIINTAAQVTNTPLRISITVNKANYTHDMICQTGKFNVSVLSEKADFSLFKRFGFQSGADCDKFIGFESVSRAANGVSYITEGTNAYISGQVVQTIDLGTHTMFIADVTDMEILDDQTPSTTYTYYQQHIKPAPKPVSEANKGKTIWRCKVCGYEYVGEELPPDFICPLCKHPASDFEKVIG